ncbi:MAG: SDR family NAD(P)-dependent oxidoreductase [Pseudonocardiaceae bacterium]|nr:SDR family NAD(P)-dependent oxidoreductase [Pseudonocardiaceae bacterium]
MSVSVLVTGASSGLGLAASTELAAAGRQVILGCRSIPRGEAAAESIRASVPGANVEVLELDVASLASVRSAAGELAGRPLGALILNAGIQVVNGTQRSPDGYELTFATNHLGHFLLTQLLLEQLAEPARIVLVSSGTHYGPPRSGPFPGPRWASGRALAEGSTLDGSGRSGRIRYATSKLANIYMVHELARRLADRDVTVNAFDPGLMPETRLARDYSPRLQRLYDRLGGLLVRVVPEANSAATSGANLARLVTGPAQPNGAYVVGRKPRKSSRESYDAERSAELWRASEQLTNS